MKKFSCIYNYNNYYGRGVEYCEVRGTGGVVVVLTEHLALKRIIMEV